MSGKAGFRKQNSTGKNGVNVNHHHQQRRHGCTKTCDFISPVRYLKHVGGKVVAVVVRVTTRAAPASKPGPKERARTSVAPIDSQRAEAIHDCIDFINSSSSLPRSNSVARAPPSNQDQDRDAPLEKP